MKILAIESSCDETAASIVQKQEDRVIILSNVLASSASIQEKYGGVVPEQAARHQLESILPVITEALRQAQCSIEDIDAIAVTPGPGLIGSLLVGVETAKTLALVHNKPLMPITHLIGHFYANWIIDGSDRSDLAIPEFPCIGLLVSGNHSDLILMKDHGVYEFLGGTRDDASGECFDKCARLLGLPYPGGPLLSKMAESGDPKKFNLPKPMWDSKDFDFSFSGLKTAVLNTVKNTETPTHRLTDTLAADLAAAIEKTICEVLVKKTIAAAELHGVDQIMVAGGVAANQTLRKIFAEQWTGKFSIPEPKYCTDNAAMIATAACHIGEPINPLDLQANPNLSLAY